MPVATRDPETGEKRPNVVLICVDQWRGDALSVAGHEVVRTPYLDQLALRGTRFARTYSATPTCVPARVGLMTGLGQSRHRRVGYQDGIPFDFETTMPGEFRRHGYQTKCVGKLHVYPERNRIGFDDVTLHDGYLHFARRRGRAVDTYDDYLSWLRRQAGQTTASDYFDNGLNCNSVVARPWDKPEALHPSTWTVTESIDWLNRRDPTCPFFLYVSFHRPHPPYDPPAWAFEQYLGAPQHRPPIGDWTDLLEPWRADLDPESHVAHYDDQTLQRARAGYYGHMSHIDQQVNRLLESLTEAGVADDTYVAFVSDHGEMMGDHDMWRKGYPYEGSAHVPLILRGPAGGRVARGVVDERIAELRDVMPTLLDCAGLPIPAGLDGRSLLSADPGRFTRLAARRAHDLRPDRAVDRVGALEVRVVVGDGHRAALRSGRRPHRVPRSGERHRRPRARSERPARARPAPCAPRHPARRKGRRPCVPRAPRRRPTGDDAAAGGCPGHD